MERGSQEPLPPFQSPGHFLIGFAPILHHRPFVSSPTIATQRIESLDLIRGIAVCGLVAINSIEFGFGTMLLIYPLDMAEPDRTLWAIVMGLGAGKFATLFSALFAAGMLLFCERAEASGRSAASVYFPRLGWLLLFGILHAYLIWHGDILVTYALTGFVLFWCRNWSAKIFLIVGCALMAMTVLPLALGAAISHFVDFSEYREDWSKLLESFQAEEETEMEALRGSWAEQMKTRALYAFFTHLFGIPFYLFWFAAMMMCFGMSLMKSGFFRGEWPTGRLQKTTLILLATGLPLTLGGYGLFALAKPSLPLLLWAYTALSTGLPLVAFGYAGLGVMWSQRGKPGFLRRGFIAVGRMAFTNYISQSLILGLIYYGHGLGLNRQLEFREAMMIVPAVWVAQMLVSSWWLGRFQYGPLEWLWRRLTYGTIAMRKRKTPPRLPSTK